MQIAILLIAIVACGFAFWIGRMVSRPISTMTNAMGEFAAGNFKVSCPMSVARMKLARWPAPLWCSGIPGWIRFALRPRLRNSGEMAEQERARETRIFNGWRRPNRRASCNCLPEGLQSLARGDLTYQLTEDFPEAYKQIREDFNAGDRGAT